MSGAPSDKVRLGVVLLCHSHLQMAARMARIWADGGAQVVIHVDAKADADEFATMHAALDGRPEIRFSPRRACNWGHFDLVQATQDAAAQMLTVKPEVTHVLLASGSCLPLRAVADLTAYLGQHPDRDFIESVAVQDVFWAIGGLNDDRFTRYFPFDWRKRRKLFDGTLTLQRKLGIRRRLPLGLEPHLGSQWWCLTRRTLSAILNDPRRPEYDSFFWLSWIPDESYFQSLARRHSRRIEGRSLTLSRFDHQGKPYSLYDDHLEMLEQSDCFVARKVWPGADRLLSHFPRPAQSEGPPREPDPSRVVQILDNATELRVRARPGLKMQSCFPHKYMEQGKTAARYAVFQGFSHAVPRFEGWLAGRLDADVHGYLFRKEGAEFAGQSATGPGALSSQPSIRDRDPEAFLTSLVRMTDRMQVFLHGPAGLQDLNWFMATDPNCRLMVITGAWIVPLFRSDMPFHRLRDVAARLQHAEVEMLKVLKSPWLRARTGVWSLADFAARPHAVLAEALDGMPGFDGRLDDLPPLHDLSGMSDFLQQMRNAGLRPALTGHFAPRPAARQTRPTP